MRPLHPPLYLFVGHPRHIAGVRVPTPDAAALGFQPIQLRRKRSPAKIDLPFDVPPRLQFDVPPRLQPIQQVLRVRHMRPCVERVKTATLYLYRWLLSTAFWCRSRSGLLLGVGGRRLRSAPVFRRQGPIGVDSNRAVRVNLVLCCPVRHHFAGYAAASGVVLHPGPACVTQQERQRRRQRALGSAQLTGRTPADSRPDCSRCLVVFPYPDAPLAHRVLCSRCQTNSGDTPPTATVPMGPNSSSASRVVRYRPSLVR